MFDPTQPRASGPYSIAAAAHPRSLASARGRGTDDAFLVWLAILSHTPWDGAKRATWATNVTLANETGLYIRRVEYAISKLVDVGLLETPQGKRPGARRRFGRVLVPKLDAPVKVLLPDRGERSGAAARGLDDLAAAPHPEPGRLS